MVSTKQAGKTLYTRSYNLKDQNMYDHRSKHVWLKHQYNVKKVHLIGLKMMKGYKRGLEGGTVSFVHLYSLVSKTYRIANRCVFEGISVLLGDTLDSLASLLHCDTSRYSY